jgi:rhamnosyltransferase subunit B
MLDILLITIGSHGDVHPFVGIGRTLAARGHRVRVATNPHFGPMIERAGLSFVPMGDTKTFDRWLGDPLVWHSTRGSGRVLAGVSETLDDVYDFTVANTRPETVVVGSSLALGALIASEQLGFRYASAHLSPPCVRSCHQMPTLGYGINLTRFPRWFKEKFWAGGDKWIIDPPIMPTVNAVRARAGLKPVEKLLDYWHAPRLTLGLWPEWYAAKQPDAPPQLQLTGFPMYDEADHQTLDAELEAWIDDGDPPIAFTPGSAMKFGHRFFEVAARACEQIGRRGLLLTRHIEQIPGDLPYGVRHWKYAPFSTLLPRCAALVHHGGIGTTAQAFKAGCPQLIMPMAHDQPDNAARVKRLGCGDAISREFFWAGRVAKKLARLVGDPAVLTACSVVARRFDTQDSLSETCTIIEAMAYADAR